MIAPGVMILASALTMFLIGRSVSSFTYRFEKDALTVSDGRSEVKLPYKEISVERNAEKSDFFDKNIIKLSFIKNRIILKNTLNDNSYTPQNMIINHQNRTYVLTLDDYAIALIKGINDEL